jgi:hypothetical protein
MRLDGSRANRSLQRFGYLRYASPIFRHRLQGANVFFGPAANYVFLLSHFRFLIVFWNRPLTRHSDFLQHAEFSRHGYIYADSKTTRPSRPSFGKHFQCDTARSRNLRNRTGRRHGDRFNFEAPRDCFLRYHLGLDRRSIRRVFALFEGVLKGRSGATTVRYL